MSNETKAPARKAQPDYIAYHVPERGNAKWVRIGAAWPHKDSDGLTLELDLMPTGTGRITLRRFNSKEDGAE